VTALFIERLIFDVILLLFRGPVQPEEGFAWRGTPDLVPDQPLRVREIGKPERLVAGRTQAVPIDRDELRCAGGRGERAASVAGMMRMRSGTSSLSKRSVMTTAPGSIIPSSVRFFSALPASVRRTARRLSSPEKTRR